MALCVDHTNSTYYIANQCRPGDSTGIGLGSPQGGINPSDSGSAAQVTASAAGSALSQNILPQLAGLTNPTTLKRIALVGAAVLLVVMGGVLIIAKPAEKVSTTAGKVIA